MARYFSRNSSLNTHGGAAICRQTISQYWHIFFSCEKWLTTAVYWVTYNSCEGHLLCLHDMSRKELFDCLHSIYALLCLSTIIVFWNALILFGGGGVESGTNVPLNRKILIFFLLSCLNFPHTPSLRVLRLNKSKLIFLPFWTPLLWTNSHARTLLYTQLCEKCSVEFCLAIDTKLKNVAVDYS